MVTKFQNTDLCRLTEQVIFTDPYYDTTVNRHTTPHLDTQAVAMRGDVEAKVAVTRLKVTPPFLASYILHSPHVSLGGLNLSLAADGRRSSPQGHLYHFLLGHTHLK